MANVNLPNLITICRILAAPIVAVLLFEPRSGLRLAAFVIFLVAALSDLWDGHLARKRDEITPFGQLFDPLADKLLLLATIVPLYIVTTRDLALAGLPLTGTIPLWAVIVMLGREILISVLRFLAARRGRVVPARSLGKRKALAQNIFIGAAILWVGFRTPGSPPAHDTIWFSELHGWFTIAFLVLAVLLTVLSAAFYLATFSRIFANEAG